MQRSPSPPRMKWMYKVCKQIVIGMRQRFNKLEQTPELRHGSQRRCKIMPLCNSLKRKETETLNQPNAGGTKPLDHWLCPYAVSNFRPGLAYGFAGGVFHCEAELLIPYFGDEPSLIIYFGVFQAPKVLTHRQRCLEDLKTSRQLWRTFHNQYKSHPVPFLDPGTDRRFPWSAS